MPSARPVAQALPRYYIDYIEGGTRLRHKIDLGRACERIADRLEEESLLAIYEPA